MSNGYVSEVEQELLDATGIDLAKYKKRQDRLAALIRAVDKLSEESYDNLSDAATDWADKAAKALLRRKEIPDFPEEVANGSTEEAEPDKEEVEEDDTEEADEDDAEEDEEEVEEEPEEEEEEEEDATESVDDTEAAEEDEVDADEEEEESEESEPASAKAVASDDNGDEEEVEEEEVDSTGVESKTGSGDAAADKPKPAAKKGGKKGKDKVEVKAKPLKIVRAKRGPTTPTRYDDLTGEKDRFGVVIGTKTHEAVKMYEAGTTAKELYEKLEGRFYNILSKLQSDGHMVEKLAGGLWKLTHKDDLKKVLKKKGGK
jgi:hypothetical protein